MSSHDIYMPLMCPIVAPHIIVPMNNVHMFCYQVVSPIPFVCPRKTSSNRDIDEVLSNKPWGFDQNTS